MFPKCHLNVGCILRVFVMHDKGSKAFYCRSHGNLESQDALEIPNGYLGAQASELQKDHLLFHLL